MKLYLILVLSPVVVAALAAGALWVAPESAGDLFPLVWWGMTVALTVLFLALIRWSFGDEPETGGAAPRS